MPQLDLVVRGGHRANEPSPTTVDIGILDGRTVQLGAEMQANRSNEGGFAWVDDFESGSAAALAGGVTSIGNMTLPDGPHEDLFDSLQRDIDAAQHHANADVFLHPVVTNPRVSLLAQIPQLGVDTAVSARRTT